MANPFTNPIRWFMDQVREYRYENLMAEQEELHIREMELHDRAMAQIRAETKDQEGKVGGDLYIEERILLNRQSRDNTAFNAKNDEINAQIHALTTDGAYNVTGQDAMQPGQATPDDNITAVTPTEVGTGRVGSIGRFFSRLFNGRLRQSSRDKGAAATERINAGVIREMNNADEARLEAVTVEKMALEAQRNRQGPTRANVQEAMEVDLDDLKDEWELDRQIAAARENPTPHMVNSKNFTENLNREIAQLGKSLYGEDYHIIEGETLGACQFDSKNIRTGRGGVSIGIAMLHVEGYSFDEIMDPTVLAEEKKQAGERIMSLVEKANTEVLLDAQLEKRDAELSDEEKQQNRVQNESNMAIRDGAINEMTVLYHQFAEKYMQTPPLAIDHTNDKVIADSYRGVHFMGYVAHDIGQEIQHNKSYATNMIGMESFDKDAAVLCDNSKIYNVIRDSVISDVVMQGSEIEDNNLSESTRKLVGLSMRKDVDNVLKDAKTMADFEGFEFFIKANISKQAADKAIEEARENDPNCFKKLEANLLEGKDIMTFTGEGKNIKAEINTGNKPITQAADMGENMNTPQKKKGK